MRYPIPTFQGLNTVSDPLTLGLAWQSQADDVTITRQGKLTRRTGYTESIAQTLNTGAYATKSEERAFVVDSGVLKQINTDLTLTTLASGLNSARMYFDEINGQIFCTNGVDYKTILPNGTVKRWGVPAPTAPGVALATGILPEGFYRVCSTLVDPDGIEGSNSEVAGIDVTGDQQIQITPTAVSGYTQNVYVTAANGTVFFLLAENVTGAVSYSCTPERLGRKLRYWFTDTPRGLMPHFWKGQCYTAEYYASQDASVLWFSLPVQFHHFDIGANGHAVPGHVRMLKSVPEALIIGTDRQIFAWDGTSLTELAPYGVVAGHHDAVKNDKLYVWSQRGIVRMLPFENLTEKTVSVAPGTFAGATVIEQGGNLRYIVALQSGGTAYNAYT